MIEKEKCQTLPPWLWICFILYVIELPSLIGGLKRDFIDFLFPKDPAFVDMTLVSRFEIMNATYWIPRIFLFLGSLSILFPLIRKNYVERKYDLTDDYQRIPALIEIENFLKFHAPGLKIKANLLSQSEEIFIYPIGYRKTGIAIFGKFIKSWRSDKEGAQAVLLHEIGHYRNGDALILGTGSFFEFTIKNTLGIIIVVFLIQIALAFIDLTSSSYRKTFLTQYLLGNIISYPLSMPFHTLAYYILPIIGIWCAELNADRFMMMSKIGLSDNSIRVIEKLKREKSLKQWLLSQISHPPSTLRRWMAIHFCEKKSLLLFLLIFPLAYIPQLFLAEIGYLGKFVEMYLLGEANVQEILETVHKGLIYYVGSRYLIWLLFSIIFISWPFMAIYWVKFFSGLHEINNLENYKVYLLSASILICTFMLCHNIQ